MNLIGNRVILRALEESDMGYLNDMINDPECEKFVVGWSKPVSKSQQLDWFKNIASEKNTIRFAAEVNGDFIGTCILSNIDWKNKTINTNIKLLEKYKNQGYGSECMNLLQKYCFDELNMNRIEGNVLEYNEASKKLSEKCGFVLEGVKRQAVYKNGKYLNICIYSILKEEYRKRYIDRNNIF